MYKTPKDNWDKHDFAILYDEQLIGFVSYSIYRTSWHAGNFTAINFTDNKISFGIALRQIIDDIFMKYNFNKLNFTVIVGNPIEPTYDKMTEKYNGRIVGTKRNNTKVQDGTICDMKIYEILRNEYIESSKKKGDLK